MAKHPSNASIITTPHEMVIGGVLQARHWRDENGKDWLTLELLSRPDSGVTLNGVGLAQALDWLGGIEKQFTR